MAAPKKDFSALHKAIVKAVGKESLSRSEIHAKLTSGGGSFKDMTPANLTNHLRMLTSDGKLKMVGERRAAKYSAV